MVLVLLLAVVACVNVAGLLVARAAARQREFAVRISIGCGRRRLARLLLAESLLLALTGVGLGAATSMWVARALVAVPLPFPVPFEVEVPLDLRVLAYLAALGLVGWALTVAGVYGLVAYSVTRRIPEIGVRVALGAPSSSVMRLLLRDGLVIAFVGVASGLIVAAFATPFLSALLAGVSPHDATSFGLAAAALLLTALAASFGPARRGIRLSPTEALRSE